jgi:hypothetical protein
LIERGRKNNYKEDEQRMALTTKSMTAEGKDIDRTPEYEVGIDSEGKGFLKKKKVIVEDPKEEVKPQRRSKK